MKRFSKYLYECEREKKIRNIGFIKVEWQENNCAVDIYGKGLQVKPGKGLAVYLFYMADGNCIGVHQGIIEHAETAINYRLTYTAEDVGGMGNYLKVNGIILLGNDGKKYAAVWDDSVVDVETMIRAEDVVTVKEPAEPEEAESEAAELKEEQVEMAAEVEAEVKVEVEVEAEALQEKELTKSYKKVGRQDISKLPRSEWRIANNSFLLHGYYNYHHLMFIEEDEEVWIGVPGVFHGREEAAAKTFGFPKFWRLPEANSELEQSEKNESDDFGYWCKKIKQGDTSGMQLF